MPIPFTCPHCGTTTQVGDQFAGQTGPCSRCGQQITIPGTPAFSAGPQAYATPAKKKTPTWVIVLIICGVGFFVLLPCTGMLLALLLPAVNNARMVTQRTDCMSRMRQISQAMDQYQLQHGSYPPAYTVDDQGRPLHSWRTLLLPYLERADLYQKIDLKEPWDSPKNSRFHKEQMTVFRCPTDSGGAADGLTNYVVISGPGAIFDGSKSVGRNAVAAGDGPGNTILLVEIAGSDIPWMEPRDIDINNLKPPLGTMDPKSPSSLHPGGLNVIFADGRGMFISDQIDGQTLKALATYRGREPVDTNALR